MPVMRTDRKTAEPEKEGNEAPDLRRAAKPITTKPITDLTVIDSDSNGGTSMRKFLAAFVVFAALCCIGVSAGMAGPHGCYRSQGCHGPK